MGVSSMKNIVVSLICGLLGAMVFTLFNNYFYSRPIAVVKLDEVIAGHLQAYGEKELTDEERNAVSERFARSIDQIVNSIAKKERVTLLIAPAVISDVPDYTIYVKTEVERLLNTQ